jgi:hypothetical protein
MVVTINNQDKVESRTTPIALRIKQALDLSTGPTKNFGEK